MRPRSTSRTPALAAAITLAALLAPSPASAIGLLVPAELAGMNRGSAAYLKPDQSLEEEVKTFYDRLSHPVLSDLPLEIEGAQVYGALPAQLPDLFKGGQLVVLGRYKNPGKAAVKLAGTTPSGRRTFEYETTFASGNTEHAFIPRLWAQRQVAVLLSEIREKGENFGLVAEVTQLATKYGIVTPYTSYLVVEDQPRPATASPTPRGGEGDLGAFAPPAVTAAADPAPPEEESNERSTSRARPMRQAPASGAAREMLKKDSGDEAVLAAKEIGRLADSTIAGDRKVKTSIARALGRSFYFERGFFIDERAGVRDATLEIEAFSRAFLMVLELRPDLKPALMLGEAVMVSVARGRTLVIVPKGRQELHRAELEKFLRKDS